ncbi:M28 family peptidase [Duganella qianjiadongensis]|uniref:M28 family peptidase n=1 Tax=Duganella qianjiadongensis TaxID=2692176 RepID=A0ABW9VNA0_9BURK|nr:M28 family metallopeptidase [Duganella qianjiadongensis]MYM40090.1 M28 family peptidase [Duganella qianjiadongensis]
MHLKPLTLSLAVLAALNSYAAQAAPADDGPDTRRHQAQIDQIVKQISPQRIEAYVRKLVSFRTRHTMSDTVSETEGIGAARRWIKGELERCGAAAGGKLQVAFDSHIAPVSARISHPTEIVNVVATLPGTQDASRERMYVVSGHYDSRNTDVMDASGDAPGANDDASGTAAVMEMACVMARYQFDATLVFMTVAAEEQGLLGAAHWAEQARQKNLNIAGMFTNDIIGSSHDEHGKIDNQQVRLFAEGLPVQKENSDVVRTLIQTGGENDSLSRQLARSVKESGERYVPGFKVNVIQRRDRYLRGGDHMPFLERGYAALRFTEPAEDFNHQHQNIRTENGVLIGDLPQYNDYAYIAQVARVNAAALATLSLAPAAPAKVQVRTAKLQNDTELVWQANAEPDLAGYRVVWRETGAADWQGSRFVGKVTEATLALSKDNYYFGVQAVDKDGNVSPASYPVPLR